MYSHTTKLKEMFSAFFPQFQATVTRDDDAWRMVDTSNMMWADQALNLKRAGQYEEAMKLYIVQILQRRKITFGWAQGIFKTLAAAGDFEDALAFGRYWFNFADMNASEPDMLLQHFLTLMNMVKDPTTYTSTLPQYLKSISGNQNYSIDLRQTDLYTGEVISRLRANA